MQNAATKFAEVYKFRFGMLVLTDDGEEGSLTSVGFAPDSRTVESVCFKFRFGGFAVGQEHCVPLANVRHVNDHEIRLTATRDEVKRQAATKSATPRLSSGTQVQAGDRRIGKLSQVTIDRASHELRHVVIERGVGQESVVSAQNITTVDQRRIATNLTAETTRTLTPYVPDEELRDEIHRTIENYPRLRVDMPGIAVRVIDGVVWLQGHTSSDINTRQIQDQLIGIHGIGEIHNDLVTDTDLASAVSHALANDPRTRNGYIGVYPMLGKVKLGGRVSTPEMRTAAVDVARQVPGVESISNELVVDPSANQLPVLAGVTGDEDHVPGGR